MWHWILVWTNEVVKSLTIPFPERAGQSAPLPTGTGEGGGTDLRRVAPGPALGHGGGNPIEGTERSPAPMSNHTYRVTEIVGTSTEGVDQAIRNGIDRASQTLRGLDWFEVTQVRGHLVDGRIEHYQVGLKVGFRLDEEG